jgi:hypothetical protein
MSVLDPLPRAILTARRIGPVPVMLRTLVAAGAAIAVVATTAPAFDVPNGYVVVAILAAVVWVGAPDSAAGLAFAALLAMAWLTGGDGDLEAAAVVTALALLLAHVAAAFAAAMPVTARADRALVLRWAPPTAGSALVVLGAAGLLVGLDAWSPAGSLVATLLALTLLSGAVWWWSVPPSRPPPSEGPTPPG